MEQLHAVLISQHCNQVWLHRVMCSASTCMMHSLKLLLCVPTVSRRTNCVSDACFDYISSSAVPRAEHSDSAVLDDHWQLTRAALTSQPIFSPHLAHLN